MRLEMIPDYDILFEGLFENSPEGVVIQGLDGVVHKANRAFCEMFGYTPEEVIGHDLDRLVATDESLNLEAAERTQRAILGEEFVFETVRQRKDGTRFHVMALGVPIVVEGRRVAIYAMYRDITDRKKAEEALQRSEEKYRAIVQQQQEVIVRYSPDWKVTFANEAYCKYYQTTPDEIVGTSMTPHMPEEYREEILGTLKKLDPASPTQVSEELTILPSGEARWQQWVDTALFDSEGNIVEYQSVGRDISDRKRMEESLRVSSERLERVLDETVRVLAGTMRIRDVYTADHQEGVAQLVHAIGEEMGLSGDTLKGLRMAALIHDIGKLHIPGEILNKPTTLTALEYQIVKRHPEVGSETLKGISFPWPIAQIVSQHHERLDGSGYPRGLRGNQILPEVRILSVADVVEAMASHRPFRPAYPLETALDTVRAGAGTLFDERVVQACLKVFERGFRFKK
ncbi:MAG: PAS domain S-box protein [Thermovirgaceae bacterium]|nr:PAS domain S-box protein [Synergistales bacterium]HPC76530.1 PAS domain S-box protein [Synergistales bacterium]